MLIAVPEGDPPRNPAGPLYEALICPKHLIQFTTTEEASDPCAPLRRSLYHQRAFDWLDATLGLAGCHNQLR